MDKPSDKPKQFHPLSVTWSLFKRLAQLMNPAEKSRFEHRAIVKGNHPVSTRAMENRIRKRRIKFEMEKRSRQINRRRRA